MPSRFPSTLDMSVLSLPISLAHMSESSSTLSRSKLGLSYRVRHESNLVDGIIFPISPAYPSYISLVGFPCNPTLAKINLLLSYRRRSFLKPPRARFRWRRRSSTTVEGSSWITLVLRSHSNLILFNSFVVNRVIDSWISQSSSAVFFTSSTMSAVHRDLRSSTRWALIRFSVQSM